MGWYRAASNATRMIVKVKTCKYTGNTMDIQRNLNTKMPTRWRDARDDCRVI
jgi:hypothetical protein